MLVDDQHGKKLLGQFIDRCRGLRIDAESMVRDAGDFDSQEKWQALIASQCLRTALSCLERSLDRASNPMTAIAFGTERLVVYEYPIHRPADFYNVGQYVAFTTSEEDRIPVCEATVCSFGIVEYICTHDPFLRQGYATEFLEGLANYYSVKVMLMADGT